MTNSKKSEMWVAPDVVPSLCYSDVPRAVEWLVRVFGFRERVDARLTWPTGCIAWLEAGDGLFSVATHDETWPLRAGAVACSALMKVYVDDVDRHFDRAKAAGASIVSEPQDGFWGGRTYRALDPEGHRWELSQRGCDLSAERWRLPPGLIRGVSR
jgi:PhnB protein